MKQDLKKKYIMAGFTAFAVFVAVLLVVFVIFRRDDLSQIFSAIGAILQPFIIGSVLAYLLAPLCNIYEGWFKKIVPKKKRDGRLPNGLAVFLSAITLILIVSVLVLLIVPASLKSLFSLIMSIPDYVVNLIDWSNDKLTDYPEIKKYLLNVFDVVYDKFETWTQDQLMPSVQTLISGVGSSISNVITLVTNIIVGFIVSIYLLNSRRIFARQAKMALYALFKPKSADTIFGEIKYADKMFSGFLRGKVVDSTIVGIICFVFLSIMNYQDVMLISVIVGVTNIIPFFGPFIGAIPSALLIFVTDPKKCLYFVIFIFILQQFDGNILGPKCMGSSIKMSAFWVLFAILLFGGMFGFVGMIIGVPLFAVIYDILKKFIYYRLKKHGKEELIASNPDGGTTAEAESIHEEAEQGSAEQTVPADSVTGES